MADTQQTEMEANLRAAGAAMDAGDEPDLSSITGDTADSPTAPVESDTPATTPEAKDTAPADADKAKSESAETDSEKKTEPPANETPYQKAKREGKEREARAWEKIEAEKAQIATQKAELEKARQAPKNNYTAEDYDKAAENAENEAKEAELLDPEEAKKHAEFAKYAREQAQEQRKVAWRSNLLTAAEAEGLAELKDPASALGQEFGKFLDSAPEVLRNPYLPNGAKIAARLFAAERKLKAGTDSVSALQKQLEAVTKERDEARKVTSIPRSGPARQPSDSDPGELSETQLRRMANEVDGMAA